MANRAKIEKTYIKLVGAVKATSTMPEAKAANRTARAFAKFANVNAKANHTPADLLEVALGKLGAVDALFTAEELESFLEKSKGASDIPPSMLQTLITDDDPDAIAHEIDAYASTLGPGSSPEDAQVKIITLIKDATFMLVAMELYALQHPPSNR